MMEKLRDNLASLIVATIFAAAAGWFLGTSQMAQLVNDVATIKEAVIEIKKSEQRHDAFMNCAKLRLYAIENGVKRPPECSATGEDK